MEEKPVQNREMSVPQPGAPLPEPFWMSELALEPASQSISVRDILIVLFKHKRKILVTFLTVFLLVMAVYFFYFRHLPLVYEARATLMLRYGNEYAVANPGLGGTPLAFSLPDIVASEVLILGSRDLREKLIDTVGLQNLYPDLARDSSETKEQKMGAAMERLEKNLSVTPVDRSQLITIAYKGSHPDALAKAVNDLIGLYKEERVKILSDPKSTQFLEEKVGEYGRKLKESEDRLEAFRKEHQMYSFDEQMTSLMQQRTLLDNSITSADTQIKQLQNRVAFLNGMLHTNAPQSAAPVAAVAGVAGVAEARARLFDLERQERDLAIKYTDSNPYLISVRKDIATLRSYLNKYGGGVEGAPAEQTAATLVNAQLKLEAIQSQQQITAHEIQIADAKQQLAALQKQIDNLNAIGNKFQETKRDVDANSKYYSTYMNKLEETRVSDELTRQKMSSVTVVQAATPPAFPLKSPLGFPLFLAGGIGGGIVAALGLAFLLEFIGQGLSVPKDAEKRMGLPVLVTIPYKG